LNQGRPHGPELRLIHWLTVRPAYLQFIMEAFFVSGGIVALAEIGDKTQLLAFLLAAKFRKPLPIVLAIFVATIANHAFAAAVGTWITALMGPNMLRWVLGVSFLAMAAWTLVPDKLDEGDTKLAKYGVFMTTLIAFFLAEMGDKTQVATVALAARYDSLIAVVAGTTFGMMLANVPAVYLGEKIANRVPLKLVHGIAAAVFAVLGLATLLGAGASFGF
jgi:putative Ca2+/H+ antiporter (TMEM165/GDT1 family)